MTSNIGRLRPLAQAPVEALRRVRLVASDIDGTMTDGGVLGPRLLGAFERLTQAGIAILPVTGRPAGEALGLARYLPFVSCAIAENGAVLVTPDQPVRALWTPPDRERLLQVAEQISDPDDPLALTEDAFCRVGDLAFERGERTPSALSALRTAAAEAGVHLVWSSVHIHLSQDPPDKGEAVLKVGQEMGYRGEEILTIGDAPNDEGLWRSGRFGVTVATADVDHYADVLDSVAEFRCPGEGEVAWLEMVEALLNART